MAADPISATAGSAGAPLTAEQTQALKHLHDVAQQWEGVFVNMLFKEMRKTESDDTVFGEKSSGEKIFSEMLDNEYSQEFSKTGSVGIAQILEGQLRSSVLANASRESKAPVGKGGL